MDVFAGAERLMSMRGETWLRHANPWSAWTRFSALPLLVLAVWSRVWLGWGALLPLALVLLWIWANPRLFPRPADFGAWPSRGVLGERIWLARGRYRLPRHHVVAGHVLTAVSAAGALPLAWGLWALDPGWTAAGVLLVVLGKAWFLDRMVWIHADVTGTAPGAPLPDPTLPEPGEAPR